MVPLVRFRRLCDRQFVVHEQYQLIVHQPRSRESHNHYFACIQTAWENLPDEIAPNFLSPEHLRKWCLVRAGYADETVIECADKAAAKKLLKLWKRKDEYAVVVLRESVAKIYTAQSQRVAEMGKRKFEESKEAVLKVVSDLIGVDVTTLLAEAGAAA